MANATGTTLVLGASGKTGRRVAERLTERQVPVRRGTRSGEPPFDWERPETWPASVKGVEAVYISYHPDLAAPGASEAIAAFTDLAVGSGVRRLVLLSGRGEPEAQRCEQIVRDAGVEWALLRSSWFCQNFSEAYLADAIRAGEVVLPAGDVGEPFIDVEDIADVAVDALTTDRHIGQLYELTGPKLWTFPDAIAEIGRAIGREIRYTRVTLAEYETVLVDAGLPPSVVQLITYLFGEVLDGRSSWIGDGVHRALGRPARGLARYASATAATGVWDA